MGRPDCRADRRIQLNGRKSFDLFQLGAAAVVPGGFSERVQDLSGRDLEVLLVATAHIDRAVGDPGNDVARAADDVRVATSPGNSVIICRAVKVARAIGSSASRRSSSCVVPAWFDSPSTRISQLLSPAIALTPATGSSISSRRRPCSM